MPTTMTIKMVPKLKEAVRSIGLSEEDIARKEKRTITQFSAFSVRETQKSMTSSGQGQPGGSAWRPLSDSWSDFKAGQGWSSLIGVAKGWLKQSVSYDNDLTRMVSKTGVGGQASDYAESFDRKRPLLMEEDYAANKLQTLFFESLRR